MPIYAARLSICGHYVTNMTSLHFSPSAAVSELMIYKLAIQVNIMALILFIYSSILAVGVWQEKQNQDQNDSNNQVCQRVLGDSLNVTK